MTTTPTRPAECRELVEALVSHFNVGDQGQAYRRAAKLLEDLMAIMAEHRWSKPRKSWCGSMPLESRDIDLRHLVAELERQYRSL